jgi:hypothetical protein
MARGRAVHGPDGRGMRPKPRPTAVVPIGRRHGPDRPVSRQWRQPAALPGARAVYGGCQSHFPSSPRLSLSMLSLTASTSSAPSGTCSASSVTASRTPVVIEYSAAGLTWAYGADMIGTHVCLPGLPAAGDRAVLARAAAPVLIVQGRGNTRAAPRGGRAAPDEPQTADVLDRPSSPRRAGQGHAQMPAGPADRNARHALALAPPLGGCQVAPAQAARTPAGTGRTRRADRAPGPGEHPVGRGQDPGRAAPARAQGRRPE